MALDLPRWLSERLVKTYETGNWSGKGVRQALEGVTLEEAHWRPAPEQHTIAELASHMAYWCWVVARRVAPDSVVDPGEEEWRPVPATAEAWVEVQGELARAHGACAAVIRGLTVENLGEPAHGPTPWSVLDVVTDLATHDSYHAAQIFVLRRLYAAAPRR